MKISLTIASRREICCTVVSLTGFAVIVGHAFGIREITALVPGWVDMKFNTAMGFVLAASALQACYGTTNGHRGVAIVLAAALLITQGVVLLLTTAGNSSPLSTLFFMPGDEVLTTQPGVGSLATMCGFVLIALYVLLHRWELLISAAVMGIGVTATFGYMIGIPILYFFVPDISTAMAAHTAILFAMLGVTMLPSPGT